MELVVEKNSEASREIKFVEQLAKHELVGYFSWKWSSQQQRILMIS